MVDLEAQYGWTLENRRVFEHAREALRYNYVAWKPRSDKPAEFDEQASYVNSKDLLSIALGGNGSGKTSASALKCAKFLLNTPPPRKDTPFWVISELYYQACSVCWKEKLCDQRFLPPANVDWDRIVWYKPDLGWPFYVPLKPWPNGNNWMLEFKSFAQGRAAMQARSIGGFWFSEQFPWELLVETLRGCRDYMFRGGQFAECTPIEPELCVEIEKRIDNPPPGWKFYRLNTDENRQNLAPDWYETFFGSVPDEMMATRKTGALATFEGTIYQSFNPAVHVVADTSQDPAKREIASKVWAGGTEHYRGIDWGASAEHPFVCVWSCRDGVGEWLTYDEYWCNRQDKTTRDHAIEIIARSCMWGWPEPEWFVLSDQRRSLPDDIRTGRDEAATRKDRAAFVEAVRARVKELAHGKHRQTLTGRTYGESFADPSRPGDINAFNDWGIVTTPANNNVYKGIDTIRSLLKVHPGTGRARHYYDKRCIHLIEETRKYRWLRKRTNALVITALPKPVPLKKADDCCDADRYCCHSVETRRGLLPSSTADSRDVAEHRPDVPLDRGGSGRGRLGGMNVVQAGANGFFRKTR